MVGNDRERLPSFLVNYLFLRSKTLLFFLNGAVCSVHRFEKKKLLHNVEAKNVQFALFSNIKRLIITFIFIF